MTVSPEIRAPESTDTAVAAADTAGPHVLLNPWFALSAISFFGTILSLALAWNIALILGLALALIACGAVMLSTTSIRLQGSRVAAKAESDRREKLLYEERQAVWEDRRFRADGEKFDLAIKREGDYFSEKIKEIEHECDKEKEDSKEAYEKVGKLFKPVVTTAAGASGGLLAWLFAPPWAAVTTVLAGAGEVVNHPRERKAFRMHKARCDHADMEAAEKRDTERKRHQHAQDAMHAEKSARTYVVDDISHDDFHKYEAVRQSGKTNIWDFEAGVAQSLLPEPLFITILVHHRELGEKYPTRALAPEPPATAVLPPHAAPPSVPASREA